VGLIGSLAEGRRRKLADFLADGHLEEGESIEASLPMMQTHVGDFAGYYGVAVTPHRVILIEWARTIPERPTGIADARSRDQVSVKEHTRGLLMGKLVLTSGGEEWIGLKVPRLHREDGDSVVAALSA
jgi:hypothetical protein